MASRARERKTGGQTSANASAVVSSVPLALVVVKELFRV
jgi:hypothetical protein